MATATTAVAEHAAPAAHSGGAYPSDDEILGITDDAPVAQGAAARGVRDDGPEAVSSRDRMPGRNARDHASENPQGRRQTDFADTKSPSHPELQNSTPDIIQARVDAANRTPSGRADSISAQPLPPWLAELAGVAPESAAELNSLWQRSSALDVFDRAVYGNDAAARSELVTQLFTDDPVALRALVAVANDVLAHSVAQGAATSLPSVAGPEAFPARSDVDAAHEDRNSSGPTSRSFGTPRPELQNRSPTTNFNPAAYAHFEQSTNDAVVADVSRSIERALDRALPQSVSDSARRRIASDTLAEIHTALRGDRDLSAQVAAALRNSNFDGAARDQIARLIASRARGIVPEAARRVVGEWTGSVLASHRERAVRQQNNSARVDVVGGALPQAVPRRAVKSSDIDYRATSDEDILSW